MARPSSGERHAVRFGSQVYSSQMELRGISVRGDLFVQANDEPALRAFVKSLRDIHGLRVDVVDPHSDLAAEGEGKPQP